MYQNIVIVGNLGRDPELRYTPDGTPVCNFSVATNRRWTSSDGSQGEETTWFRITAWRRMAEVCAQYLSKGRQVLVEGHLRLEDEVPPDQRAYVRKTIERLTLCRDPSAGHARYV
jgi:single-strand DNA-binding protein